MGGERTVLVRCGGTDGRQVHVWCEVRECNGLCVTVAELEIFGYPGKVAYPHPECPEHGDPNGFDVCKSIRGVLERMRIMSWDNTFDADRDYEQAEEHIRALVLSDIGETPIDTESFRHMRSLLGKRVTVTLDREGQATITGRLLWFNAYGEVSLRDDAGVVVCGWPNLETRAAE